jgi:hypothetical protein
MEKYPITIANCWSIPNLNIAYTENGIIFVELKNNSTKTITIKTLEIEFETEPYFKPYSVKSINPVKIKSKNIEKIQISFLTKLILRHLTNVYKIKITFSLENQIYSKISLNAISNSLIIHSCRPVTNLAFVSHKDPEDTELGNKVDFYLQKIGFEGYLAENDSRPGLDFWKEKIHPKIDESNVVIILWTKNASQNPKNILREVNYAKKKKKRIILVPEKDVKIPKEFSKHIGYHTVSSIINEKEIVKLVTDIEKTYHQGGYS